MKVVFMGTPDFAKGVLESIYESGQHEITAVVTQPDKPKGRSDKLVACPVKEYATEKGIPVLSPVRIRNEEEISRLREYEADIFIVAAFGQILPKEILDMPKFGCINVHASLLPKYRGAAPIQWAIADEEKKTGVTIMQMDEGLDTGDIITQKEVPISDDETGESLFDKLMYEGAELLKETLVMIENGTAKHTPQNNDESSYAKIIKKEMGKIDFTKSAKSIECLVRAFTPWPGGYTYYCGKIMKIKECKVANETITDDIDRKIMDTAPKGSIVKVTSCAIYVLCGDSILEITGIQPEGKKAMSVHDFLLGNALKTGDILGR